MMFILWYLSGLIGAAIIIRGMGEKLNNAGDLIGWLFFSLVGPLAWIAIILAVVMCFVDTVDKKIRSMGENKLTRIINELLFKGNK